MPALEIPAQLLVEHAGSDLQQKVGTRWGSPHLLCLHKPLADNLVDRGFDETGRNGLAVPVAVGIVRDRRQVSGRVTHELFKFVLTAFACSDSVPISHVGSSSVCSAR